MDYKSAGVDIEKGDQLVERIKKKVRQTYGPRVLDGVGGFAALYDVGNDRLLASGCDGVGTKLILAQELGIHHTIGQDLVAMCVNDVICTGANPIFFLDYFACGKLDLEVASQVIEGITQACIESECALIGGETAEMPGLYNANEYDLAGFCVGEVFKKDLINGSNLNEGDLLIAIPSSGPHSNGYSLIRQLIRNERVELKKEFLTPTALYPKMLKKLKGDLEVKGVAHITGGGWHNIPRISQHFDYVIDYLPPLKDLPETIQYLQLKSKLDRDKIYETFNMGIGLVIVVSKDSSFEESFRKHSIHHWVVGRIKKGGGNLKFQC